MTKEISLHERPMVHDTADYFAALANYNNTPLAGGSYVSCGVTTLAGLSASTPEEVVHKVLKERHRNDAKKIREAFVIFSDIDRKGCSKGGNAIYKYIRENNLGNIVEFGPRMNPNTGNMIKMWVWEPPHASLDPKDKDMDIHGMVRVQGPYGTQLLEVGDSRLKDPRFQSCVRGA